MVQEEKNGASQAQEGQKLTYEQLVAYAQQVSAQAQKILEENQMLKKTLSEAMLTNTFKEIELALKCLDHADMFSATFIEKVIKKLEEVLTPPEPVEQVETDNKEN